MPFAPEGQQEHFDGQPKSDSNFAMNPPKQGRNKILRGPVDTQPIHTESVIRDTKLSFLSYSPPPKTTFQIELIRKTTLPLDRRNPLCRDHKRTGFQLGFRTEKGTMEIKRMKRMRPCDMQRFFSFFKQKNTFLLVQVK
ncbi:hypothetical protein V6N11_040531 [Hibiscus sabdariffa]|uniref:Uncharacterized protein n=1 Tax=Hibiscus sabdariffa TaxID=183260 RepID=A0ABR2RHT5_9ROSI